MVEFIDKNLRLGQKTYALIYQPEDLNHDISFLHEHIFDLSTVEARINIIGNKQLSKKLKQFSSPRIDVGTAVSERMDAGITVPQTREKMLTKSLSLPSI